MFNKHQFLKAIIILPVLIIGIASFVSLKYNFVIKAQAQPPSDTANFFPIAKENDEIPSCPYSIINNIQVTDITSNSAKISWDTGDTETYGKVEYGESDSYGSTTSAEGKSKTHEVTLENLSANKEYHFRVKAWTDDEENSSLSEDRTFTTQALPTSTTLKFNPNQVVGVEQISYFDRQGNEQSYSTAWTLPPDLKLDWTHTSNITSGDITYGWRINPEAWLPYAPPGVPRTVYTKTIPLPAGTAMGTIEISDIVAGLVGPYEYFVQLKINGSVRGILRFWTSKIIMNAEGCALVTIGDSNYLNDKCKLIPYLSIDPPLCSNNVPDQYNLTLQLPIPMVERNFFWYPRGSIDIWDTAYATQATFAMSSETTDYIHNPRGATSWTTLHSRNIAYNCDQTKYSKSCSIYDQDKAWISSSCMYSYPDSEAAAPASASEESISQEQSEALSAANYSEIQNINYDKKTENLTYTSGPLFTEEGTNELGFPNKFKINEVKTELEYGTQSGKYIAKIQPQAKGNLQTANLKQLKSRTYYYKVATFDSEGNKHYSKEYTLKHGHWFFRFWGDLWERFKNLF